MTHPDAFALQTSDLNAFLFADVGTELNGSPLTILSMLARLGQDPWAAAAKLANLPRVDALEHLARSIGAMPLGAEAVANVRTTAARLVQLLPVQTRHVVPNPSRPTGAWLMPHWLPIALLCASIVVGLVLNMLPIAGSGGAALTPTAQSVPVPGSMKPM